MRVAYYLELRERAHALIENRLIMKLTMESKNRITEAGINLYRDKFIFAAHLTSRNIIINISIPIYKLKESRLSIIILDVGQI